MKVSLRNEVKNAKKLILGNTVVEKKIRNGGVSKVFVASNCKDKEKIMRLCKGVSIECIQLDEDSKEVAVICKKPFSVSCLGIE